MSEQMSRGLALVTPVCIPSEWKHYPGREQQMSWGAAASFVQEEVCQCLISVAGLHVAQGQLQTEAQADSPGGLQGTEGDSCQLWQLQD